MVTGDETVKILDFGLATFVAGSIIDEEGETSSDLAREKHVKAPLTTIGRTIGTPDFMSPEQANKPHSVDIRSDIYSLGCTLYCLLTARTPFEKESVTRVIHAHADVVAEPLENVRKDIPPDVASVVRRMMAKQPADRFQTPAEVAESLAPFAGAIKTTVPDSKKVAATHRSATGETPRWRPTLFQAIALGASALIVGTIFYVLTDGGKLIVESADENSKIAIRPIAADSGWLYRVQDTATGSTVKWLRSGRYVLELQGGQNESAIPAKSFLVRMQMLTVPSMYMSQVPDRTKCSATTVVPESIWRRSSRPAAGG
jgi:serine/threonine protein kinase